MTEPAPRSLPSDPPGVEVDALGAGLPGARARIPRTRGDLAHRRRRWVFGVFGLSVAVLCAMVGAARVGVLAWHSVRPWYSEEVTYHLGPALDTALDTAQGHRPRVLCSGLAVLVLDDHPVARLVAAGLAEDLAAAVGASVPVHDASTTPFAPGDVERPDVLALVDLVHLDAEDWFLYQRCQVRLNVALGRPPRAVHDGRGTERRSGEVLDHDASFALEYSVDGHWEVMGLAARDVHFASSARSIVAGLSPLVEAVEWARVGPLTHVDAMPPSELAPLVPRGVQQRIYELVRANGAREILFQVTTERDWLAELQQLESTALGLGWQRRCGAQLPDGRPRATVLERPGERFEASLAYMQGTARTASEQRQVLSLLHRTVP